jgi:hypothetical protein
MEGLNHLPKKGLGEGNLLGFKVSRIFKIMYLVFVDDVLIMSKALVEEWTEIKSILIIFCRA